MSIILAIIGIVFFTAVLNIIIIQSNNFIFIVFRRPVFWIVFMGFLSFFFFFIGSKFDNSFNIVWTSAFLAFLANIPPQRKKDDQINQKEQNELVDAMYENMGIRQGRLKYRIGLISYLLGGLLGWILFYSVIIEV